jgi:DNA segregation ATPase FtsK/SpoIIIE-like protein
MWTLPPKTLLKTSTSYNETEEMEAAWREAALIESRCEELGIPLNIENIQIGPSTIRYDAVPAEKIAIRSLGKLSAEIEFALGCESVSIQTPVPGEKYVGISTARSQRRVVMLGDIV